jgi:hypothetical protein
VIAEAVDCCEMLVVEVGAASHSSCGVDDEGEVTCGSETGTPFTPVTDPTPDALACQAAAASAGGS